MSHSGTPSFFKQPAAIQHQWVDSPGGPSNIDQQQHLAPSSNTLAAPRQGHPLLQNIPTNQPWQAQAPPQQQPPLQRHNNQQSLPPLPQSQQPSQQQQLWQTPPQPRPQHQPQQLSVDHTSNTSQQGGPVTRSPFINSVPQAPAPPHLHPEIRFVDQLMIAHAHKTYFSGHLNYRIERLPDGRKPHKEEDWTEVFAQLDGATLRVWYMKEASKQGQEVPLPSSIDVTSAFIWVRRDSVTVPATPTVPLQRYTNIIMLNTMGSNLLLFSCPSPAALVSWVAALRLAAWEKSRLDEIYTAHLIRIILNAPNVPTTLVQGKMEGWAKIQIAGQTHSKRVWLVVQEGSGIEDDGTGIAGTGVHATMKRVSGLFSRETTPSNPLPAKSLISMFTSPKPKDRKKPLLTVHGVTQAFAVYPERPEFINWSKVMKVEGTFGDDEMAATFRMREGWVWIIPEPENKVRQAAELVKWVVGLHDAFELYGRPKAWTWDTQDPVSLMFGYPMGPQKDNLFLERDIVEGMDLRQESTSIIRSTMKSLLQTHMKPPVQVIQPRSPLGTMAEFSPVPPPIAGTSQVHSAPAHGNGDNLSLNTLHNNSGPSSGRQLPPLNLGNDFAHAIPSRDRPLTPITERSNIMTHGRTVSMDDPSMLSANRAIPGPSNSNTSSFTRPSASGGSTSASIPPLDKSILHSPPPASPNTLLAHPQNGFAMDPSPTVTDSAWHGTHSSINSMNRTSTTSLATSAFPESPKVQDNTSNLPAPGRLSASSSAAGSVQAEPMPTPSKPGFAQSFRDVLLSDHRRQMFDLVNDDPTGEPCAAFSYLDLTDAQDLGMESSTTTLRPKTEPFHIPHAKSASSSSLQQPGPATGDAVPYKSSFTFTNEAAECKLKAQAQQAATHAATYPNGKPKMKNAGAWKSGEEEEEEDDDMDSDGQKFMARASQNASSSPNNPVWLPTQTTQTGPNDYIQDVPPTPSHLRPPWDLPQIPPNGGQSGDFHQVQPMPRQQATEQYADSYRRSHYEDDPGHTPGCAPQLNQPSSSAPKREGLVRETSLIKISKKPPPLSLGAISTHERARKREGDYQRQQLDQKQQEGLIYGGQFGFNPMSPAMMSGGVAPFSPMMTGQMGSPGIMGGFNPQHIFAAQQAAQVYHQNLMAFSTADFQVGGEGGNGREASSQVNALNSGMAGMNAGMNAGLGSGMNPVMGGYDPRMSMMGMLMMGMGIGMGMSMSVAPCHMNQMPPRIQMTGTSAFDPFESSPGGANGFPVGDVGLSSPNQNA